MAPSSQPSFTASTAHERYIMATFDDIADLCRNRDSLSDADDLAESVLVEQLISSQIDPDVLATTNEDGQTLLHIAAAFGRSPEFCQLLIDLNPSLMKARDNDGLLPLHLFAAGPVIMPFLLPAALFYSGRGLL